MTRKQQRTLFVLITLIFVVFFSLLFSGLGTPAPLLPTQAVLNIQQDNLLAERPDYHELESGQEFLIQLSAETSQAQFDQAMLELGIEVVEDIPVMDAYVARRIISLDTRELQAIVPNVVIEPNYQIQSLLTIPTNDPLISEQWALDALAINPYWEELPDNAEPVTVAVIDSGICLEHEDLQGRILDNGYDYVNDDNIPNDLFGHGCAVSGIIAANSDNGIGITGVAPNVNILPIRVLDEKGIGNYADLASAIYYAVDNGADIINLSLGGQNYSQILEQAVNYALGRDVKIVAGTGNSGQLGIYYPARYEGVVAVGSLDASGNQSDFTSYGPELDTLAPGENILTTSIDGQYSYFTGTSMAVPYITGLMAVSDMSGIYLNLDHIISTPVPDDDGIGSLNIPTNTPTNTPPPPLPTATLYPGLSCDNLYLEDIRFSDNRIFFEIFNNQSYSAEFDAFRLEWPPIDGFPNINLATMTIDSEVKWFGEETSPAEVNSSELISTYLFEAYESQFIQFIFLNSPANLYSEWTIEDFAGSTLTFNGINGSNTTCIIQIPEDLVTEDLLTYTPEEGFRCDDIQISGVSFDQNMIHIDFNQSAFDVQDFIKFTQFDIHYPSISGYPNMYFDTLLIDNYEIWSGDNTVTSPVTINNLSGHPNDPDVLPYNNNKRITLSFANSPATLSDFMTVADLSGTLATLNSIITSPHSDCVIDVVTTNNITQCGATHIKYAGMAGNTIQYRVDDVDVASDQITRVLTASDMISGTSLTEITIGNHTLWSGSAPSPVDTSTSGTFYPYQAIDGEIITFHYDFSGNIDDYFYPYDFTTGVEYFNTITNSPCAFNFIEFTDTASFPPPALTVQPIGNNIQLDWEYNQPAESFIIERQRLDGVSPWITLATVADDVHTFDDVTFVCDVSYRWKVTAYDGTYYSMPSYAPTLSSCDFNPPTDLTAQASDRDILLSWNISGTSDHFEIYRRISGVNPNFVQIESNIQTTSYLANRPPSCDFQVDYQIINVAYLSSGITYSDPASISYWYACPQTDLAVAVISDKTTVEVSDFVEYEVSLINEGNETAHDVIVFIDEIDDFNYSTTASSGIYNDENGRWTIPELVAQTTETLTFSVYAYQTSISPTIDVSAEIISTDAIDPDSTPNNGITSEDDYDIASVSLTCPTSDVLTVIDGDTSGFIKAVASANIDDCFSGQTTITLAPDGLYEFTEAVYIVEGLNPYVYRPAMPLIISDIIIEGNGAEITNIGDGWYLQTFIIEDTGALDIRHMTLSNFVGQGYDKPLIHNYGKLAINNVRFTGNDATYNILDIGSSPTKIENSLFYENDAEVYIASTGAIIQNNTFYRSYKLSIGGDAFVGFNTFYDAQAPEPLALGLTPDGSGTITVDTIGNLFYSSNSRRACFDWGSSSMNSLGYNIMTYQPSHVCDFDHPTDKLGQSNLVLQEPLDNGGKTLTVLPAAGSIVIDYIPPEDCPIVTDQRGFARPYNSNCDVGAVERGASLATPTNLVANQISGTNNVRLEWTDNAISEENHTILRRLHSESDSIIIGSVLTDITEFIDTTLECNIRSYYQVRSENDSTNSYSDSISISAVRTDCFSLPPDGILLTPITGTPDRQLKINWQAVEDIAEYEVEYYVDNESNGWNAVGMTTTTSIIHDQICETHYGYRIRSIHENDNNPSAWSPTVTNTASYCLPAPTNLTHISSTATSITIGWQTPVSGTDYETLIERKDNELWTEVTRVPATQTQYTDTTLTCATASDYRLFTYHTPSEYLSNSTAILTISTLDCPINIPQTGSDFYVNITEDNNDFCGTESCSLRSAITAANQLAGANTIYLPAGVITMQLAGVDESANLIGDFDVTDTLTIIGHSSGTTIDANNLERHFEVIGGIDFTLNDLTLVNGYLPDISDSTSTRYLGGSIFGEFVGTVTLNNVTLSSNQSYAGGAIRVDNSTALMINDSHFENNQANYGGGVSASDVTIRVDNSDFIANTATYSGGAFSTGAQYSAWIFSIYDSTFHNNDAGTLGGAIFSQDQLDIRDSVFEGNTAKAGGAIRFNYRSSITRSLFRDNHAIELGGAIVALNTSSGTSSISEVTIIDNTAGIRAGGIFGRDVSMRGTTIARNVAGIDGGGAYVRDEIRLINTTIVENEAGTAGGGLYIYHAPSSIDLYNTIIANNIASDNSYVDCYGRPDVVQNSLIETTTSCNNPNSPAIDSMFGEDLTFINQDTYYDLVPGNPGINSGWDDICHTTDQLGNDHRVGGYCDIGAVESPYMLNPPTNLLGTINDGINIHLSWDDNSRYDEQIVVERSTDNVNWAILVTLPAGAEEYNDKGLECYQPYYYRVSSRTVDYIEYSTIWNATTTCEALVFNTNISSSFINETSIQLSWSDDNRNESGFRILRRISNTWSEVGTVAADVIGFEDTTLDCSIDQTYDYQIQAYRQSDGITGLSSILAVTTANCPFNAPTALISVSATITSLQLTWTDNSVLESAYHLQRSIDNVNWVNIAPSLPANTTSYMDDTIECETTYYYQLKAYQASFDRYTDVVSHMAISPQCSPELPQGIVSAAVNNQTSLSWQPISQKRSSQIIIERAQQPAEAIVSLSDDLDWQTLTSIPSNLIIFTDFDLKCATNYWYRVKGYNAKYNEYTEPSDPIAISTADCPVPVTNTVGLYRNGQWLFRDGLDNSAPIIEFRFGPQEEGWTPLTGDWDGDGVDGIGIYKNGIFALRDISSSGVVDYVYRFGSNSGEWQPLVGDWNGDGTDTVGIYRKGTVLLTDSHQPSGEDYEFNFGFNETGWTAIKGDWYKTGRDLVGIYKQGTFLLQKTALSRSVGASFNFGLNNDTWQAITGDWNEDGYITIGLFTGREWLLRNTNSRGTPDITFNFGNQNNVWVPIASYRGGEEAIEGLALNSVIPINVNPDNQTVTEKVVIIEPVIVEDTATEEPQLSPTPMVTVSGTDDSVEPTITATTDTSPEVTDEPQPEITTTNLPSVTPLPTSTPIPSPTATITQIPTTVPSATPTEVETEAESTEEAESD